MTYNDVLSLITGNLADVSNITASDHRAVEQALLDFAESQWLTGDIKEIDCDDAYITANFTGTGLGINERAGWAICNGQNGTRNRTGRVSVAYGASPGGSGATAYTAMGTTGSPTYGGSKDAVVVSHEHYTVKYGSVTGNNNSSLYDAPAGNVAANKERPLTSAAYDANSDAYDYELTTSIGTADGGKTSTSGVTGTDKNMPPYIVTLFIQKL